MRFSLCFFLLFYNKFFVFFIGSVSVERTLELALEAEQAKTRALQDELERLRDQLRNTVT